MQPGRMLPGFGLPPVELLRGKVRETRFRLDNAVQRCEPGKTGLKKSICVRVAPAIHPVSPISFAGRSSRRWVRLARSVLSLSQS